MSSSEEYLKTDDVQHVFEEQLIITKTEQMYSYQ